MRTQLFTAAAALALLVALVPPAHGAAPAAGAVPPDTPVMFYLGLKNDSSALWAAARDVSTPGRPQYRQHLTLREAGRTYGATQDTIARLKEIAARTGVRVSIDRTGLFARAVAPASTWSRLVGAPITSSFSSEQPTLTYSVAWATPPRTARAAVPAPFRSVADAFVPVQSIAVAAAASSPAMATRTALRESASPPPRPTNPAYAEGTTCLAPETAATMYSPWNIHRPYGTTALAERGLRGKGARLTVLALGIPLEQQGLAASGACFGYAVPRVRFAGADGVREPLPVTDVAEAAHETTLDLSVVAPVLREAGDIRLVQTPAPVAFTYSVISAMATGLDQDGMGTLSPDVISMSYGVCSKLNRQWDASYGLWGAERLADQLFAMAALVGTSVFVSAGDAGSAGCTRWDDSITAALQSWPASSHWVTAVGGTLLTLNPDGTRANEVPWNEAPWGESGGTGGGPALGTSAPWYQAHLTPSDRRIVPDVVAHASPQVGWAIFIEALDDGVVTTRPLSDGGTSASTPFIAANVALLAAHERSQGRPSLGFVNPWLYAMAREGHGFTDIVTGNNQTNPESACCIATRGFDMASGLGAPRFVEWAKRIAAPGTGGRAR